MTRARPIAVLVLGLGAVLAGAWQEPQFRAGTHTVSIYATVLDSSGRLVPDLKRDDFEVLDNGTPQDLSVFTNDIQPITIVIMLDRSGSMTRNFGLVRDAAEQFVGDLLPDDRARLGNFSNRIEIDPSTFTSDQKELLRILNETMQEGGPTPLWNATSAAMNALDSQEGRRVVLLFTDGKDEPPNPFGNVTLPQVRDRSQKEGIMVYAIGLADGCAPAPEPVATSTSVWKPSTDIRYQRRGPRIPIFLPPIGRMPPIGMPPIGGPRTPPPPPGGVPGRVPPNDPNNPNSRHYGPCARSEPDPGLAELAADGGGGYFELKGTDDLTSTFKRVAEELHHQYMFAFAAQTLDGKVHQLEVKVHQPGMTARARKSYVATADK